MELVFFVLTAWRSVGTETTGEIAEINAAADYDSVVSVLFCTWPLFHVRTPNLQRKCQIFLIRCKNALSFRGLCPLMGLCPLIP